MMKRGICVLLVIVLLSPIIHAGALFGEGSVWEDWFTGKQILTKGRYETSCFDHTDNDGDKKIDCDDSDCRTRIAFPLKKAKTVSFRGKTVAITELTPPFRVVKVTIDNVEKILNPNQEVLFENAGTSAYLEELSNPENGNVERYLILGGGPIQSQNFQLATDRSINFAGSKIILKRISRTTQSIVASLTVEGNPLYFIYHEYYNRNDAKGKIEPWTGMYMNVTSIRFSSPEVAALSVSSRTCTRKFESLLPS